LARQLELSKEQSVHYWSTTDVRLVTKPDTLLPYIRDARQYWYVAVEGTDKIDPIIESERIVATSLYH
jgi:hypothetical protein